MSATDDYGQGVDIATLIDAPNAETLARNIVNAIVPQTIMKFQSASERNATLTAPVGGMMAWLNTEQLLTEYDGTAWTVVAAGTQSWKTLPLASGYTHDGNSNGTAQYRVVNLFGEPTVMLRGGIYVTYDTADNAVNDAYILSSDLPAAARPVTLRTTSAPCSVSNSSVASIKLDAHPDGKMRLIIKNGSTPPWVGFNGVFYSL